VSEVIGLETAFDHYAAIYGDETNNGTIASQNEG
jgi:hypothetical protein